MSNTRNLESRVRGYLAIATAAAAALAADSARAEVVAWANCNLVVPANIDGLYINVETRQVGSAAAAVAGWDINPYSATSLTWFNATGTGMMRYPGITTGSAGNLAIGTSVGPSGSYGSGAVVVGSSPGQWQLNATNRFGFRFVAADGQTRYGWGTFQIGAAINGADRTITNLFYESSPNVPIVVGAGGLEFFRDLDGDGYGSVLSGTSSVPLPGYVANNSDCDDTNALINPTTVWHRDLDGDGFGVTADGTLVQCTQPAGYALQPGDNCPTTANASQANADGDSAGDACDACPSDPVKIAAGACGCGFSDADLDGDGTPNCLDVDDDGDGTSDQWDLCPLDSRKFEPGDCGCGIVEADTDADGWSDCIDPDDDGDGVADAADGCPLDSGKSAPGQCGCGTPETDTDGDGISDCVEPPLVPCRLSNDLPTPVTTRVNSRFGSSVSLIDDKIYVGCPLDDTSSVQDCGSVFAYTVGTNGVPNFSTRWLASSPQAGAQYGASVVLNRAFGPASSPTMYIGAPYADRTGVDSGAVYRFNFLDSQPSQVVAGDRYGSSVAAATSATTSSTGFITYTEVFAAGAPGADPLGSESGAAYIGIGFYERKRVLPSDGAAGDRFGQAVACSDLTVVVGAPGADVGGQVNAGAVYVFALSGQNWVQVAKLVATVPTANGAFGSAMAIEGDELLVGEPGASYSHASSGVVRRFVRGATGWAAAATQASIGPDGLSLVQAFGSAISRSGSRMVIGAPLDDTGGADRGSYLVYDRGTSGSWTRTQYATADVTTVGGRLGAAVAVADGRFVVAAPLDGTDGAESGRALLLQGRRDCDNDGADDLCAIVANPALDANIDGILDACQQQDTDSDGIRDVLDNCALVVNADQSDADFDGIGDACDPGCFDGQPEPTAPRPLLLSGDIFFVGQSTWPGGSDNSAVGFSVGPLGGSGGGGTGSGIPEANVLADGEAEVRLEQSQSSWSLECDGVLQIQEMCFDCACSCSCSLLGGAEATLFVERGIADPPADESGRVTLSASASIASGASAFESFGFSCLVSPEYLSNSADDDGDGIVNCRDNAPNAWNPDQSDRDGDGVGDVDDICPDNAGIIVGNGCVADWIFDLDGDGVANGSDGDLDGDGVLNSADGCPNDRLKSAPGACGCGALDVDDDVDGVADCLELPATMCATDAVTQTPPRAGARLGAAVAANGGRAVAGAPNDAVGPLAAAGRVALLVRSTAGRWDADGSLVAADASAGARFGAAVAVLGDVVAVGAPDDSNMNGAGAGAVYLFRRSEGGSYAQFAKLLRPGGDPGDSFGAAVALNDAGLFIGAPRADDWRGVDVGAVEFYQVYTSSATHIETIISPIAAAGDRFGSSVAAAGRTVVVGSPNADEGVGVSMRADAGHAQVFALDALHGCWRLQHTLRALTGAAGGRFGAAVATDDACMVIGEPGAARAHFFERSEAESWARSLTVATSATATSALGAAVAVRSGTALIGVPEFDASSGVSGGTVRVYRRVATGAWSPAALLVTPTGAVSNGFGAAVAVDGFSALAGAAMDAAGGAPEAGIVHAFTSSAVDCNANGVPDACELAQGTLADANANGRPDVCESTDSDGDGASNAVDGCPNDPQKTAPGACGCGVADTDSDGDGVANCRDGCPNDPLKSSAGACGCGVADTDTDGDQIANCFDLDDDADGVSDASDGCPTDPSKSNPGTCGCGVAETDSDGDGIRNCVDPDDDNDGTPDASDGCPTNAAKTSPGVCGCGAADTDSDGDGAPNCNDACPNDPLKTAPGVCGCGVADIDTDGGGLPDCADPDDDNDGYLDIEDGCPLDAEKFEPGPCGCGNPDVLVDTDLDGAFDCVDTDDDGDGVPDAADQCPLTRGVSAGGGCATGCPTSDCNGNGICDYDELASGALGDCDGDGIPDACDVVGVVVGWGDGASGELGAVGVAGVQAISAGFSHSLIVRADGTVGGFGSNASGEREPPAGLSNVIDVAAGLSHSYALVGGGALSSWGSNANGERNTPADLGAALQVACGARFTVARRVDGGVRAWGTGLSSQLAMPSGLVAAKVDAGWEHAVALRPNGTVACWGGNGNAQCAVPSGLSGVVDVAAGAYHTVALRTTGEIVAWGLNDSGQVSPVPPASWGAVAIDSGLGDFNVAINSAGELRSWGVGREGLLHGGLPACDVVSAGGAFVLALNRLDTDCNANLRSDDCDLAQNPALDCDDDGLVDSCQPLGGDCDQNGVIDRCQVASGTGRDCDVNGVLDSCDAASGNVRDCNTNGVPDACEIADGLDTDIDADTVLDSCERAFGDLNLDGLVNGADLATLLGGWGAGGAAAGDLNNDGLVNGADLAILLGRWGSPPPWTSSIASVSPSSGPSSGGTLITLQGTNLGQATGVRIGGVPATSVTVVNSTTITAVTPVGTLGPKTVSVSVPGWTVMLPDGFTYTDPWYTVLEQLPNPAVVTSAALRNAIVATGYPWRVRDNGTNIEMVLIPPGTFNMGCSASNAFSCGAEESPIHSVTLTGAFYMGRYEVTQAQWQARMGSNPSAFQSPSAQVPAAQVPSRPVERVSWSMIAGTGGFLTGTGLRLPTEAEWEYAYRAGTTTAFHGFTGSPNGTNDDTLVGNIAWWGACCGGNSAGQTRPVGGKLANGFGLHDMSGNVWEWVNDWYSSSYYASSPSSNPTGPASGTSRVLRGGLYDLDSDSLRSSYRSFDAPESVFTFSGFRVARSPL